MQLRFKTRVKQIVVEKENSETLALPTRSVELLLEPTETERRDTTTYFVGEILTDNTIFLNFVEGELRDVLSKSEMGKGPLNLLLPLEDLTARCDRCFFVRIAPLLAQNRDFWITLSKTSRDNLEVIKVEFN